MPKRRANNQSAQTGEKKKGYYLMKSYKKVLVSLIAGAAILVSAVLPISAAPSLNREVSVYINGSPYYGTTVLFNNTTYVGLRAFCNTFGISDIEWRDSTHTAYIASYYLILSATEGDEYIVANGRYFWCEHGIFIKDGGMFIPLRAIAKAFGSEVVWNEKTFSANVITGYSFAEPASTYYDLWDVYWLSHIIHAEAGCEPLLGKIAVGNVVLNRVASPQYPNTIYGVIFDMRCGPQFTPAATGSVYMDPDEESIIAAKLCLEGYSLSDKIEFFMKPAIADTEWMRNNCTFVFRIAHHDFYMA